jgi:peroxiredoxin (alkyl hydroperoxide reductase subunit C)
MAMLLGQILPEFTGHAVLATGGVDFEFNLSKYRAGRPAVLFFYAMNFSYVCPTELLALANRVKALQERNFATIAIACEHHLSHLEWRRQNLAEGGIGAAPFPLIADSNREIAKNYGVLVNGAVAARACFIADADGYVRFAHYYDFPFGRNLDEITRCADMLLHHQKTAQLCPAGWQAGHRGLLPSRSDINQYLAVNAPNL